MEENPAGAKQVEEDEDWTAVEMGSRGHTTAPLSSILSKRKALNNRGKNINALILCSCFPPPSLAKKRQQALHHAPGATASSAWQLSPVSLESAAAGEL